MLDLYYMPSWPFKKRSYFFCMIRFYFWYLNLTAVEDCNKSPPGKRWTDISIVFIFTKKICCMEQYFPQTNEFPTKNLQYTYLCPQKNIHDATHYDWTLWPAWINLLQYWMRPYWMCSPECLACVLQCMKAHYRLPNHNSCILRITSEMIFR